MTDEDRQGPFGGRLLTDAEWRTQTLPLHYIHLKDGIYESWGKIEFDIAVKWCVSRCSDWFYYTDKEQGKFVFGAVEDYILFKLWVSENRMIREFSLDQ